MLNDLVIVVGTAVVVVAVGGAVMAALSKWLFSNEDKDSVVGVEDVDKGTAVSFEVDARVAFEFKEGIRVGVMVVVGVGIMVGVMVVVGEGIMAELMVRFVVGAETCLKVGITVGITEVA